MQRYTGFSILKRIVIQLQPSGTHLEDLYMAKLKRSKQLCTRVSNLISLSQGLAKELARENVEGVYFCRIIF